jgi:hypothetical protein
MNERGANPNAETKDPSYCCEDCDQPFKTPQGLAGHRRLAHSTSTRSELEAKAGELAEREAAAKRREAEAARQADAARRREAEAARREQEIAETGPAALGLSQCPDCRAWFGAATERDSHVRKIHPIEEAVAKAVSRSRQRVDEVWREAARKQGANPERSPDWVVNQFWSGTDQRILRALLARNASLRFAKEGE